MNFRKKIAACCVCAVLAVLAGTLPASGQMVRGEKSVGAKIGYVGKNSSADVGLVFQYALSSRFRLSPEVGCVFKHQNLDAFTIDLNLHMPFAFTGNKAALYPLAGLNYSSWYETFKDPGANGALEEAGTDVSSRYNRFGVNLGAGFELRCSRTLKVGIEAKYTLLKRFSGGYLNALICYTF
ncbi:MAG: outer membrane beta-barrel protein [Muribaculaceae bacterium]|nr:outer membrane beta-barrel protein [Muribaculaceae bacterium]MDE6541019.1 outer membrane beta-barrel protein [Muribaculaceae bacterium]